jgi:2-polyprenyl-6-methoxyphenol hydroxylase-like FAD-dependent oxidoreductase
LAHAGHEVTVIDLSTGLRNGGNGVDVREQAVPVILGMGLVERVAAGSLDTKGFKFETCRGSAPIVVNLRALQAEVGYQDLEIPRGDLARVIHDATLEAVDYRFGVAIAELEQDHVRVRVLFTDGTNGEYDLVIGADGLHSGTRRIVFGPESEYVHFRNFYFGFGSAVSAVGEEGWARFYNKPGRSLTVQAFGERGDQGHFMFRADKPIVYDYRDVDAQRDVVRKAFVDDNWFPPELLTAIDAEDFYFDSISQVKMESWHKGRVVLVGDAAYCASPASGAGALLAITGAYRLAGAIAQYPDNLTAAFCLYQKRQQPLVAQKQKALFTGITVPSSAFTIWLRNIVLSSPLARMLSGVAPKNVPTLEEYDFGKAG